MIGNGAQHRDILVALVAGAELGIDHAGPVADEDHRQLLVTDVDLDLLQHPHRHESREPVDDGAEPGLGKAGGDSDHVLLGNAAIDILVGAILAELVNRA